MPCIATGNNIYYSLIDKCYVFVINSFAKKYEEEIKNNDVISRHHAKHSEVRYAPAWKTLEYISFGDLIRLIENLKDNKMRLSIYKLYR